MRVILIGGDRLVYFLSKQFLSVGYQLTIINRTPEDARSLSRQLKATVILGDGSNPAILQEAKAYEAGVLLALTAHDQDNLVACQIAQIRHGVGRTIALVNDPNYKDVFEQLGITVAFSATQILASLIEQQTVFFDIKALFPVAAGKVNITEVVLDQTSPAVGKSIQSLSLPTGSLIGCIVRDEMIIVPHGRSVLKLADRLILISQPNQSETCLATFLEVTT
ncbi:MAG: NAD-binding protein [Cyanobacteria bacterium J06555_13]